MNAINLPFITSTSAYAPGVAARTLPYPATRGRVLPIKPPATALSLLSYIAACTGLSLSASEKQLIQQAFKFKTLKRRQYLLQEGDVCKYMGFIVKGAMRMFSVNDKGQECVLNFGLENNWMTDQESFTMLTPSHYYIEAVENTELLLITNCQLQVLAGQIPAINKMVSLANRQQLIANQQRVHAAISMSAEERYHALLSAYPEYGQRFPQNMLASYLGIKSETLSRLRKR